MILVFYRAGFTLQEALECAYIDDIDEIFVEPPDSNILTDEDSAEEDEGGTLDNLSGRQLRSKVELKLTNNSRIIVNDVMNILSISLENAPLLL